MATTIGNAILWIKGDDKHLNKTLQRSRKNLRKSLRDFKAMAANMAKALAAVSVAMGGTAIKLAADFDKAMREVNTLLSISEHEFQVLKNDVLSLSASMGIDAVEAAQALYQAISAGVPRENAITFLKVASKAAIAGVTDTKTAVDGLTTVMNAFKIGAEDAERVADLMFTTVKNGKTTFSELSGYLYNVAPIASAAGVSFDDVAAAIASVTKQGVPTAQATVQIRQAIQGLLKPTDTMTAAFGRMGVTSGEALLQSDGLAGALKKVRAAARDKEDLARMTGSVVGMSAVLSLTGANAQMFAQDLDGMKKSAGATQTAFEKMEVSTSRRAQRLWERLKDLGIVLGSELIPIVEHLANTVLPGFSDGLDSTDAAVQRFQRRADNIVGAIAKVAKSVSWFIGIVEDAGSYWGWVAGQVSTVSGSADLGRASKQKIKAGQVSGTNPGGLQSPSGTVNVHLNGVTIREEADVYKVAAHLARLTDRQLRLRGARTG